MTKTPSRGVLIPRRRQSFLIHHRLCQRRVPASGLGHRQKMWVESSPMPLINVSAHRVGPTWFRSLHYDQAVFIYRRNMHHPHIVSLRIDADRKMVIFLSFPRSLTLVKPISRPNPNLDA